MLTESTFSSLINFRMSSATINEPTGKSDTPFKFTAGLILGIHFDAIIQNISDIKLVRLKVLLNSIKTMSNLNLKNI